MKNTINIHNEANIQAEGKRNNRNCKPVICIETGEVFSSSADAAEKMGVHFATMSAVCTGKIRTCKGMHFCHMNSALENLDAVMTRLRETAAMEDDARKWREYQAEQEAIRKAEEKRLEAIRKEEERKQREITKAKEKVAKYEAEVNKYKDKWYDSVAALNDAQMELETLLDNNEQNAA